jgi:GntR family transcriptional regulator
VILSIDPSSAVPLFEQLAASVRAEIGRGRLSSGERLPSAREVAHSLDVNLHTVLRAYQLLKDEGLVDLRRGRGAVITEQAEGFSPIGAMVTQLVSEAGRLGLDPEFLLSLIKKELAS